MDLSRLLSPRSIVTVGGRECARVIEECDRLGFSGTIHAVHPKRASIAGRTALRSVLDLSEPPDAAFVAVPNVAAVAVVRDLARIGCGGVVVYSADFAEAGHADLQAALVEAAGAMPLVGPNCYGLIDAGTGAALWPDVHGCSAMRPGERGVALVTQSSNVAINLTMQRRGLPIRRVLTAGNAAQVSIAALASAALADPDIGVLALHIESVGDPSAFAALAHAAHARGKPIVVLKAGRSEAGAAAARTHTASLAGGDAAHRAFFRHLGVATVDGLEALLETARLLLVHGPLAGRRVLSLSCSGGEAGLVADAGERHGIEFPPLGDAAAPLAQALGPRVTLSNPLDYHTFVWGDREGMLATFRAAAKAPVDAAVLVLDWPRGDADIEGWHIALDAFAQAFEEATAAPIVLATLPESVKPALAPPDVPWLGGLDAGMEAIAAASSIRAPAHHTALPALVEGDDHVWSEAESKAALGAQGLVVPRGAVVASVEEAVRAADGVCPAVVKALGIAHKSEAGAVRLNLRDAKSVRAAATELLRIADTLLVEAMATRPGVELIVGVSRDPVLGPVLTLGAGGVLTELLADTATLLLPTDEGAVRDALSGLRIAKLLDGWRGADAADMDALVASILCIAGYATADAATLVELDVNPLIATAYGAVAVDALIVSRDPPPPFRARSSPAGAA